jgi:hypothetical protein
MRHSAYLVDTERLVSIKLLRVESIRRFSAVGYCRLNGASDRRQSGADEGALDIS